MPIRRRSIKWYGCRRDIKDARDIPFRPRAVKLPKAVDLRHNCPPVMDQGELGSCTAHGITGALRCLRLSHGKPDMEFSRLQLYFDERTVEGTVNDDAGAEIRDGIKCAAKLGVAHEHLWPYDISKFTHRPPEQVYTDAQQFQALTYERVKVNTVCIKQALAMKLPVIIGVTLYESFESDEVAKTGILPMPNLRKESAVGGHCMYVVGYGQKPGYFTVRNSWNTDWGDKGDLYMPESYLGSSRFGSDYWVVKTEEM